MADSTQRFSDRVDNYVRFRPGYPAELVDCLRRHAGLSRDTIVADIGSGTGIFTELLLPHVSRIHAVEPNEPMRRAAERTLGARAGFASVNATAEATSLPSASVDLVTAGQAFHWFRPAAARAEFARILRRGGFVALAWNERLRDATPFQRAYEKLLRSGSHDYDQVKHSRVDAAAIAAFFTPQAVVEHTFPSRQEFDWEGLAGRALSSSYVPNVGQPGHAAFMAELQRIHREHAREGRVKFDYTTRLFLGQLA